MNNNREPHHPESPHAAAEEPTYSRAYIGYVLVISFLAMTLSFADRQLVNILLEPIKQEFNASDTEMGLLTGLAFVMCYAVMSIPLARLADRYSRRNMLAIAMAVWSAMTAFCGMSGNFVQLALARFGVGIGEAGGGPASYSMVADYVRPQRRSAALGILSAGAPAGILLSMYGGAVISTHYGWRAAFLALGVPGVLLALLIYLTVREPVRGRWDSAKKSAGEELPMRAVLLALWRDPATRTVAIASGVTAISGFASGAWMPSFFMRVHGLSLVEAGMVLGLGGTLGGMLGGVVGGMLADRMARNHPSWQLKVAALGTLLSIPSQMVVLLWHGPEIALGTMTLPLAVLMVPFGGFFIAFMQAPSVAAVQNLAAPHIRTQATAAFFFVSSTLGMGLGPISIGILNDLAAPLAGEEAVRYSLLASLLFMLLGAVLFWRASHHYAAAYLRR